MSKGWLTTFLLLGVAVIGSNSLVLSPVLTDVAADLDTAALNVSRAIATYGGATAVSALLFGFTIDRYGIRTVLVSGSVLLAVAVFCSALAGSWGVLALAQGTAGLAAGVMLPAIYAAATRAGGEDEGARLLGRVLTGWSVALVAGVPVSALVAERFGWQASYFLLGTLILIALIGFSRMGDHTPRGEPKKTGIAGTFHAARLPGVTALLAVQFLFMTAFYGTYAFLGDHLQTGLGMSTATAGLVVLVYGVGFGIASLGDGLIDRFGPVRTLPPALGFVALALGTMPATTAFWSGAFAAAFIWGFANHFVLNVIVLRLNGLAGTARGTVFGLNSAITYAGALVGPLMLGLLYARAGFDMLALGAAACVALGAAVTVAAAMVGRRTIKETT
jgi:predicted MFS family arabinose efflux permease